MEKLKELINRLVDVKKLIITVWISLWVVLIMLTIFKFCFNVWYPVIVDNQKFISVCNFIDNHDVLVYLIWFVLYVLNLNITVLIFIKRFKYKTKKELIIFNIFIISGYFLKMLFQPLGVGIEMFYLCVGCSYVNIKQKVYKKIKWNILVPIILYVILNIWQTNVMFVRGLRDVVSDLPFILTLAIQIDYYVFLLITWIGVVYIMGLTGMGWWWSQQITRLTALKEKELKKAHPDMDVVAEYDAKIKNYEQKLKEVK